MTQAPTPVRVSASACPVCGKPVEARYRPFCSKRCADVDLNRWFGEQYRVPTAEPTLGEDTPPEDD